MAEAKNKNPADRRVQNMEVYGMMAELIDRIQKKYEAAEILRSAQVPPVQMTALYLLLLLGLDLIDSFQFGSGGAAGTMISIFVNVLTMLLTVVLGAGFVLYLMAVRRGERSEFLTLFDGFSFVGKLIAVELLISLFITLWSFLFVIPGIIAMYRYRFALYNLYEDPGIGVLEAIDMSKRQTYGYKGQLFMLDLSFIGWSILAMLPTIVMTAVIYSRFTVSIGMDPMAMYNLPSISAFLGIPGFVWVLIQGIWSLAVSLFYLAKFYCVDLAYFETAKRTSGIGKDARPSQSGWNGGSDYYDGWNGGQGPDGLGGL